MNNKKKKIVIDGRALKISADGYVVGAIGIFIEDIVVGFKELGVVDHFVLVVNSESYHDVKNHFPYIQVDVWDDWKLKWIPLLTKGKHSGRKYVFPGKYYEKMGGDLAWYPDAMPVNVKGVPSICTIHDMFWHNDATRKAGSRMLRGADTIVTISKYTANELQRLYPAETEGLKINVIPNAIRDTFDEVERVSELNRPFILDVNSTGARKNPMTLLKAYQLIKDDIQVDLVFLFGKVVDVDPIYKELLDFAEKYNLTNRVHFFKSVTYQKRNWLYKNAMLLVNPSVMEGFGRTPVEAGMCGIPVITTKETTLEEVTLGMVNYVNDPYDENELARLIKQVIETEKDQRELDRIAKSFKETYSPVRVAKMYLELIEDLVGEL